MLDQTTPGTAATLDTLKLISAEDKRRMLAQLLAKKAAQPQTHPASFGQERLWFMEQLEGQSGKATYNIVIALGLQGRLHQAVLLQSLNEIVRRHAVLRTTFQTGKRGDPIAVVASALALELPIVDLTQASEDALQAYLTQQIDRPFDLTVGPLLRAELIHRSANEHILVWVVHHSVFDGFSIAVWTRELSALYTAFFNNRPSPLPELSLQYHDFARWQREQMTGGVLQQQLDYWKNQLAGAPPLLKLPTDNPRPEIQTTNGQTYRHLFSPSLSESLKRLSKNAGVTLFTTLQSAFTILLARSSGQRDIVIGTAVTSRSRPQFEPLIGFLVNTLALRTDLSDNPIFSDLLKRVQSTTRDALINQDVPFERLVSVLSPDRNTGHAPIAQVSISWTQALMDPGSGFAGLIAKPYPVNSTTAQRDLSLLLTEMEGTIASLWEYNTDLFAPRTIERMVGRFEVLLQAIVAGPESRVLEIPILPLAEYDNIVHHWNATNVDYGTARPIHSLFEEQTERTPQATAVVFQGAKVTYAELNARSNQLAHHLRHLGVEPDTLVAVAMQRSIEMIASLLAILKAGGAYVPIDPTYPAERTRYILGDSGASILITQSSLDVAKYARNSVANVLFADALQLELASQSALNPISRTSPHHLAYVIYTSGSTGNPKGVAVEHAGLFNYLQWCLANYGPGEANGTLLHSSLAFDLTVTSIWSPLLAGGRIHILPDDDCLDVLVEGLRTNDDLSFVKLTPAHLRLINQQLGPHEFRGRARTLIIGGEALHRSMLAPWLGTAPEVRLLNEYGPTEAVVGCVVYEASGADKDEWVKIGKPIANTKVYILDEYSFPLPVGVPGELHIGGAQLARGYWNRDELTAERFIAHPTFGRLYKTGDLCRWLSDGNIEYIGRVDFQLKIRGFRIEPGEIEGVLLTHPAIHEAVVVARDSNTGQKQLVAYVVLHPAFAQIETETLRQHLAQRLPEYMIPAIFVKLSALPLNSNGKVDHGKLPLSSEQEPSPTFVAPRSEMEIEIASVFAEVLNEPIIGVHDNFFHMGGDSILVLKLASLAGQRGYSVRVKDLFRHPTVAQLAAALAAADVSNAPKSLAPQGVQLGEARLLPVQRRFLDANHADMHHSNQPFLLTVKQPLEHEQLKAAIEALIRHHDALRFQYYRDESGWHQHYFDVGNNVPLTIVELHAGVAEERNAQIEAIGTQAQASLNPLIGDLVRFVYFRNLAGVGDADRLLIVVHHLAMDGISRRLLMEDLTTLLDGANLPPKTSSYREWAEALHSAVQKGRFDTEMDAWLEESLVAADNLSLYLDDVHAPNMMGNSHYLTWKLDKRQTAHLLRTLPGLHNVTPDACILTALTETMAGWSGHTGLRVKMESYGRQELFDAIDLSRTVGWFTSIYPMAIPRFAGSAIERISLTQERLRRVTDGGLSFGALQYYHPDPEVRARFQTAAEAPVMYNNFSQLGSMESHRFAAALESPGVRVSPTLQRDTVLDCDVLNIDGQVQVMWRVSRQIQRANAELLFEKFQRQLDLLIAEGRQ